jgi:hypothetical protein
MEQKTLRDLFGVIVQAKDKKQQNDHRNAFERFKGGDSSQSYCARVVIKRQRTRARRVAGSIHSSTLP